MSKGTVLVTGGLGYVGSRLCPHLLRAGWSVRTIDLALYGEAGHEALLAAPEWKGGWSKRFAWIQGDIRDPSAVRDACAGVDAVIHLAAISNDPTGEVDEVLTRQVNFDAVGLLLAVAKDRGVRRFINASSSSVFGVKKEQDVVESLEPEPITAYSRYKMLSEWLVITAADERFCAVNIRPATICGWSPRQRFDLTVNKLTADAALKGVITVHGGEQRRPNVAMSDVLDLYAHLLEVDASRVNRRTFNFGFENMKVIDIARLIQEVLGGRARIEVTSTKDLRDYHIAATRLCEALDYRPRSSIRAAVEELLPNLGAFGDIEASHFHNMRSMKLSRSALPYGFLAS